MTAPRETARSRVDTTLGMALFIGSWSMAFATLFLSFLILRHREPVWPPQGVPLPSVALAGVGTLLLLASSVAVSRALGRLRSGRDGFAALWGAALVLALGFAGLQSWLWADVWAAGLRPHSGNYAGLFYMLTWFHALHVLCGLVALGWVQVGALAGRIGPERISPAVSSAIFWHFVDAVWVVLFLGFFVF
ncbi:MAG: cytochrome c oxidase subunit 3 [Planctomycetota bacterium]